MKRYRLLSFFIDSTRRIFNAYYDSPRFEKDKQEQLERIRESYGESDFDSKVERWQSIPKPVLSIVAEHTDLLHDIENAYISGSLYSALTGACCLGERIFNQIILSIKESYKSDSQFKNVYRKDSINDWNLGIYTLLQWDVIVQETEAKYRRLSKLRNDSVHFQKREQDLNSMTKEAIDLINQIVSDLFELKKENKFILWFDVPGELYLRKEAENIPFIRAFYIPGAPLVGFKHTLKGTTDLKFQVIDHELYEDKDISDGEFVKLRSEFNKRGADKNST